MSLEVARAPDTEQSIERLKQAYYAKEGVTYEQFSGAADEFTAKLQKLMLADLVSERLHGTACGIFNAALGRAVLPASLIAGLSWDWYGPSAPFLFGAALAVIAVIGLLLVPLRR
jgi:hypothetical protein